MAVYFAPIPSKDARALQSGALDANAQKPERHVSDGEGNPCRHCLENIEKGDDFLILAYTPFDKIQPYAETGPIFLHADPCPAYAQIDQLPPVAKGRPLVLIKAYDIDDRIIYGKGQLVPPQEIKTMAQKLFFDEEIAYLHARSALNNCYSFRIERE